MCGIAATFAYRGGRADQGEVQRACDAMSRRGPDGHGLWSSNDGAVVLGHQRLAIIDLSERGAQPMRSADGHHAITYNGEIYNYRELRVRLEKAGHSFRSDSDTEVLLHLYAEHGHDMVHHLRGMFALAIWDEQRRRLFVARDPYGIKPLYIADDGRTLRVASQVKSLLTTGAVDTSPSAPGHTGFYLWGHVPEGHTFYRGIRGMRAGSWEVFGEDGAHEAHQYARTTDAFIEAEQQPAPVGDAPELIREALLDSVRHHLVADVEVGVFLSAGLDSTAVASLTAEIGPSPRTLTIAFEEYRGTLDDEAPIAEEIALTLGARHETIQVSRSDFQNLEADFFAAMDQPSTDGLNTFLVSHAAAQAGLKVALSGVGGDELFAGYPSFTEVPRIASLMRFFPLPGLIGRGFRAVSAPVLSRVTSPKYAGVIEYGGDHAGAFLLRRGMFMPWELPEILGPDMAREGWKDLQTMSRLEATIDGIQSAYGRVAALEATWYMRNQLLCDTDWASMAHSLEVRTPLVDWHLLRRLAPVLVNVDSPTKAELMSAVSGAIPASARNRPKTGFTTPVRQWLHANGTVSRRDRGLRGWARHVHRAYTES